MTVSEHISEYVFSLNYDTIPDEVKALAKTFFIDAMACMFLGTSGASVRSALPYVKEHSGADDCVFPSKGPVHTDVLHCAMLCAMSAHSNDYDDMSANLNGHPSALLASVVFSMAQKLCSDGKKMLTAYIAGVEVDAILGSAFSRFGYQKGINPTNFVGVFGAVAAAAVLLGQSREELANALCIAVNEASGFKANFGTLSKDFAIGMSAMKAISCAECASLGFKASLDAFEGDFGFFKSICGTVDTETVHRLIDEHCSDFLEPGLVMKPYPSCRGNHSGIDCITKIVRAHSFTMADVEKVICRTDRAAFDTDRYEYPKTPDEAKFSLAFCIAKVIKCGEIVIEDFIGDEITDRSPLEFIDKVEIQCTPERFETSRFGTEVEVRLRDGRVFIEKGCFAKGDPCLPMTQDEIREKLTACLTRSLPANKVNGAAALFERLDELNGISEIINYIY